jgi:hypothetical protein
MASSAAPGATAAPLQLSDDDAAACLVYKSSKFLGAGSGKGEAALASASDGASTRSNDAISLQSSLFPHPTPPHPRPTQAAARLAWCTPRRSRRR